MLIRRITQHIKEQNWSAVFVEIIVVIAGVFIGLQVSLWNEEREEREVAESYLERIKDDLQVDVKYYQYVIDYYSKTRVHAIAALQAYEQPAKSLGADFLIDLYQASQNWNLSVRRGTYNELLATGRIGLISSEYTRSLINNYYETGMARTSTAQRNTDVTYRQKVRMQMHDVVQIQIRQNCNDEFVIGADNFYYLRLPNTCEIDVPKELLRAEVLALYNNNEIRQELRFQLSANEAILDSMKNGIASASKVLSDLEANKQ